MLQALKDIVQKAFMGNGNCAEIGNLANTALAKAKGE